MSGLRPSLSLPSSRDACAAIGDSFTVEDDGVEQQLVLEEVKAAWPRMTSPAWRMPYSMFFRGPAGARLRQGPYWVSHPEFGRMCLFLVPRSQEPRSGAVRYEAVFD